MTSPWWKTATVYQIYPRSFCDSNGDGVGDLEGVRQRLDHLQWLGVDAIWLSPFFRSPMRDYGYDVADYCDVDPLFGTLADFDRLLAEAHQRGIRMVIDWVPNHSSSQHPWFVEARAARTSAKRDWYIWRDGTPDRPPNNWRAAFTYDSAWTWDETTRQWYLHLFLPEQPDLNWANPEVEKAMHATLRFWLDRGVDGFRMDVINCIGKDPTLPDVRPEREHIPMFALNEQAATHAHLRRLRALLDEYPGDRMMVGEVALMSTAKVARYYGQDDEMHLAFNFPPLYTAWDAAAWREGIDRVVDEIHPRGWPTWVLSNHDNPRHRSRYGSEARARAAAVLLLTLRGTAFLYAGEELGLEDGVIPPERVLDPGGRDGCRSPIPWTSAPDHGWGVRDAWLPWPPQPEQRNAASLRADDASIVHLYRRLLAARKRSPALQLGSWLALPSPAGVLAYERAHDDDRRVVIVNFTAKAIDVPLSGSWVVEVASDGADDRAPYRGSIAPDQALLLR